MPATYALTIAGASKVMREGTWDILESVGRNGVLRCTIGTGSSSYRPALGAEVLLTENGTRIYGGNVTAVDEHHLDGDVDSLANTIEAESFQALATRVFVEESVPSQNVKTTLTTLVGYLSGYSVSLHASQANGPTLAAFEIANDKLNVALDGIAKQWANSIGGGVAWQIDCNKKLRMFALGTLTTTTITTANKKSVGPITVKRSRKDYANRVIVKYGDNIIVEKTQTETGNGSTDTWVLDYPLAAHRGYITVNGSDETLATDPDVSGTWVYDPATNSIIRDTPVTNGHAISITYNAQFPTTVTAEDSGEIAGNGLVEYVELQPGIYDVDQAQDLADAILLSRLQDVEQVTYVTNELGLFPAYTQTLTFSERSISGTYTIQEVETFNEGGSLVRRRVTASKGTDARPELVVLQRVMETWTGVQTAGTPDTATAVQGPPGPAGANGSNGSNGSNGADGKTTHSGSGNPSDGTGVDGDFYIDTSTPRWWGPKASGTWAGTDFWTGINEPGTLANGTFTPGVDGSISITDGRVTSINP